MSAATTRSLVCSAILILITSAAFALNSRSAVSVNGSDANLCTTVMPCRSFSAAMAQTAPGGEIIAFDSAGFGTLTINQAVSVSGAPGIHAAITANAGTAISISAAGTDHVTLRNLVLIGNGATSGISIASAAVVNIYASTISGFGSYGISSGGTQKVVVDSCKIIDSPGAIGVQVATNTKAVVSNSVVSGNNVGVFADISGTIQVFHSVISDNNNGLESSSFSGTSNLMAENCSVVANGSGVFAGSGGAGTSRLWLSNNVIFGNVNGVSSGAGAQIYSYGNNRIDGNTTDLTLGTVLNPATQR